jgi:hypothetical protein
VKAMLRGVPLESILWVIALGFPPSQGSLLFPKTTKSLASVEAWTQEHP